MNPTSGDTEACSFLARRVVACFAFYDTRHLRNAIARPADFYKYRVYIRVTKMFDHANGILEAHSLRDGRR